MNPFGSPSSKFWAAVLILAAPVFSAAKPAPAAAEDPAAAAAGPRSRTFLFTYAATVTGLPSGKPARVWLPIPPSNDDQDVKIVSRDLPAAAKISEEPEYGDKILYLEARADDEGKIPVRVTYRVTRREVKADFMRRRDDGEKLVRFLKPDAKVPINGKPLELLEGKKIPMDQVEAARLFYDLVNRHMRYNKEGTGWGRGDAVWACENGRGNCTDFHSLFTSLARSQKIPTKFEIGFPLPDKHGSGEVPGYHCWAKFKPEGKGWIPVDISEANKNPKLREYYFGNLTPDRVAFSTGRDITLVPKQAGEPLNYFVYPYVEVDGKPWPADKVQKKFSFKDVPPDEGR